MNINSAENMHPQLQEYLNPVLIDPISDFLAIGGKNIRPKLVWLGCSLSCASDDAAEALLPQIRLEPAQKIVELIHAGALIIDDVEDSSQVRRNAPAFHLKHGLPQAINSGNWLYFHALGLIPELILDHERERELLNRSIDFMSQAHCGQAIDIGVRIDTVPQAQVKQVCLSAMELKTSTLLNLALGLGHSLAPVPAKDFATLALLGNKLGLILQMFDDIGNFAQPQREGPTKRLEDLRLLRPGWLWAVASELCNQHQYRALIEAVTQLPDEAALWSWAHETQILAQMRQEARQHVINLKAFTEQHWPETHPKSVQTIVDLCHLLETSYV
jgi:geranylgeranyl pyrophosphate synthase